MDSSAVQQRRAGFLAAMLRELGSVAPILGRLVCPSREPARGLAAARLPLLLLPETLLACVLSMGGLSTTLDIALTCRPAYALMWQSPVFWRSLLQALGVPEQALLQSRAALAQTAAICPRHAGPDRLADECEALRDFARHWFLGISLLTGTPEGHASLRLSHSTLDLECRRSLNLKDARRAVLAIREEDGALLIQRASAAIARLLGGRAAGKQELLQADELLEAVSTRCDIFSTKQMLDMLGAHQQADEEERIISTTPKNSRAILRSSQPRSRDSRRRREASNAEMGAALAA